MTDLNNPLNIVQKDVTGNHYFKFNILTKNEICVTCAQHRESEIHVTTNIVK